MNKFFGIGNLTKDPEKRYSTGENSTAVTRFGIALQRRGKDAGADFPNCVAFGNTAESIEKYFKKGSKIAIVGHIQTGSYEKDGHKVYTTEIIVDEFEFVEKKSDEQPQPVTSNGFMDLSGIDVDEIPF